MSKENVQKAISGFPILGMNILMYIIAITVFIVGVIFADGRGAVVAIGIVMLICDAFFLLATILVTIGFVIIQPNEAAVLLLFGKYVGTLKQEGFWWVNPFYTKKKISLRLRNLNSDKLKVNDKSGNPIEIAAVIVWKVEDTYAAFFEVDNYTAYVNIQSESAIRHLASAYHYDNWEDEHAISLRSHIDEVSVALEKELENRLIKAGVRVLEARLMHLAYAPEIAETMLRRQQATAIIAARQKIVEGAVSMVRMALEKLDTEKVVHLDEERRATMVSNLLVVLCGESHVQPVVNAGTLYT